MKKLVNIIFEHLLNREPVSDELLYEFLQDAEKIVTSGCVNEIPSEFWEFQNYVDMYWRSRKYEREENRQIIYQMGQLLACVNMIRDIADTVVEKYSIKEYARQWRNRYPVFKAMHNECGITHKKLAQAAEISPSALSQFVNRTKWDGYFTSRTAGREKYYYLTEQGEELYKLLRDDQEKDRYVPLFFDRIDNRNSTSDNSGVMYKSGMGMGRAALQKNSFR